MKSTTLRFYLFAGLIVMLGNSLVQAQDPFWEATNSPDVAALFLSVGPDGTVFMGSNDGFGNDDIGGQDVVLRSTDGGQSWTDVLSNGLPANSIGSLLATPDGTVWAGSLAEGIFRSDDNGASWEHTGLNARVFWTLAKTPDGQVFAGTQGRIDGGIGGVFRRDEGVWTRVVNGLPEASENVWSLAGGPDGTLYAGTTLGVHRSDNKGASWASLGLEEHSITSVAAHPAGILLAAIRQGGLFRSVDGGASWMRVDLRDGLPSVIIRDFAIDIGGTIFAATADGVARSADGKDWEELNSGLTDIDAHSLAAGPDGLLWVGTASGVFRSTQPTALVPLLIAAPNAVSPAGTEVMLPFSLAWEALADATSYEVEIASDDAFTAVLFAVQAIEGLNIEVVALADAAQYYWRVRGVNAAGAGPWSAPLGFTKMVSTAVEEEPGTPPEAFTLGQNYPNPFNPRTTIPFRLTAAGPVTLKVFDVTGREVATLVSEHLPAGRFTIDWQAADAPSGVYIYQLSGAGTILRGHMVLLK